MRKMRLNTWLMMMVIEAFAFIFFHVFNVYIDSAGVTRICIVCFYYWFSYFYVIEFTIIINSSQSPPFSVKNCYCTLFIFMQKSMKIACFEKPYQLFRFVVDIKKESLINLDCKYQSPGLG